MNRRSGMTLIELVIALAILAMVAATGGHAFATIIDQQATIRNASTEVERAAALRETIRQWILQGDVQLQRGGVPRGARGGAQALAAVAPGSRSSGAVAGVTAAASTGNELTVVTNGPNPLLSSSVRIRIFVDADEATPEKGLTIEYQSQVQGAGNLSVLQRRQLDADVGDLTVEFFDQRTGRWLASTEASTGQPVALRFAMLPAEGKTLPRLLGLPITLVFGEITP